jgi:acyl-CoA synthetase (AMP-forming)/AMP-acid ligase II
MRLMTPSSIVDIISARAATDPDALAYGFLASGEIEAQRLTWSQVEARSVAIAAAITACTTRGARVLLLFPPGLDFVPAFVGCLRAGAIALPAYPPSAEDRTASRVRGMIADAGVSLILSPDSIHAKREALEALVPEAQRVRWLTIEDAEAQTRGAVRSHVRSGDVALLQYTSGSTSTPRGVVITHGNLLHNLACAARTGAYGSESVGVSWLPVNHDMGLIGGILQPAFSGFPVWLMAPAAFLQRPARWLQAISRLRATHSAGPNFAYGLCTRRVADDDRRTLDLSSWTVAYNGSEPVRMETMEAFQRAFGECGFRWESFVPAYGLAESTLFVCGSPAGDDPVTTDVDRGSLSRSLVARAASDRDTVTLVSSGSPADSMDVAIVDPVRHTRCGPNQIGEIWIAGASVAAGYWNRPDDTAATFNAFIEDTREGPFLRTGDLGFLRHGHLFVTGRIKDVLIVRGAKHYPQDLELTAERASSSIRAGCTAAFTIPGTGDDGDEDVAIAIVAEIDARRAKLATSTVVYCHILTKIRQVVADTHHVQISAVELVPAGTLPRTTSGKLQRFKCRDMFLAGSMPLVARWQAPLLKVRRAS